MELPQPEDGAEGSRKDSVETGGGTARLTGTRRPGRLVHSLASHLSPLDIWLIHTLRLCRALCAPLASADWMLGTQIMTIKIVS